MTDSVSEALTSAADLNGKPDTLFFRAWWQGVRPYALALSIDFTVSLIVYCLVWCFQLVEKQWPLQGFAAGFIAAIHSAGGVAAFGLFAYLMVSDIFHIRRGR
jgi:hypothetical protein